MTDERHATDEQITEFARVLNMVYVDGDEAAVFSPWPDVVGHAVGYPFTDDGAHPETPDDANEFVICLCRMAQTWTDADFDALRLHLATPETDR